MTLTTKQLAEKWNKHPKTILRLVRTKGLPVYTGGGKGVECEFDPEAAERWRKNRKWKR